MTRPDEWFTVPEAAHTCRRTPKTIRNLVARYSLPHRRLWIVHRRHRYRVIMLSPTIVAWLQRVTLERKDPRRVPIPPA